MSEDTEQMLDLETAIINYGNASFECGEWDESSEYEYDDVNKSAKNHKEKLKNTINELIQQAVEAERERMLIAITEWVTNE
jgi:hypothetical protein